jgi:hypothetical protein
MMTILPEKNIALKTDKRDKFEAKIGRGFKVNETAAESAFPDFFIPKSFCTRTYAPVIIPVASYCIPPSRAEFGSGSGRSSQCRLDAESCIRQAFPAEAGLQTFLSDPLRGILRSGR